MADTNILVSAFGWEGPERRVYGLARRGILQLVLSPALLEELQRVLHYPKFQFGDADIGALLNDVRASSRIVVPEREVQAIARDPPDNRVLECALAGSADWIVSGDQHLLDLGNFEGIPIVTARELLDRLEGDDG